MSAAVSAFQPDFTNVLDAARNVAPRRLPLYEHIISESVMERILGRSFAGLAKGGPADRREYTRQYVRFFREMGYDMVSFERLISSILPGSGALYSHAEPAIHDRGDFERYPWDSVQDAFFRAYALDYALLGQELPPGMRAVGGPGNGLFECVQDLVGYENLCYIAADDPELYGALFAWMGEVIRAIWQRFLPEFGGFFAVCRMGDDLGFRSATLLSPEDIRRLLIQRYRAIVELAHEHGKPFLLHSCGNIFAVMDDLIGSAGIDAKHSNEDAIAPFSVWLERYGKRIGNFGGVALGSGNSIPEYVPPEGYLAMVNEVRALRGDFRGSPA